MSDSKTRAITFANATSEQSPELFDVVQDIIGVLAEADLSYQEAVSALMNACGYMASMDDDPHFVAMVINEGIARHLQLNGDGRKENGPQ